MRTYLMQLPFIFNIQPDDNTDFKDNEEIGFVNETNFYREKDLTQELPEDPQSNEGEDREQDPETNLPIYCMDEVLNHDTVDDCWIILYDKIFDITLFLQEHPAGEDVLMEHAGRDATIAFRSVGHSTAALKALDKYLVGILPDRQRMFPTDCENRWSLL